MQSTVDPIPSAKSLRWLIALFSACWLIAALTSNGFLEDDSWTHYLYARFAPSNPAFLLDVWGRPICTGLFALVAPWAGMMGCRVVGLLLVAACTALTMRTAKALNLSPRLTAMFLLGQPMLFLHSLSVMTELPFAVLLIATFLAYVRERWWLMALLAGFLPLGRPEGFGFILLAGAALLINRKFSPIVLLALPLIAWSWLGWWAWGAASDEHWWLWLRDHWPYSVSSSYGHGFVLQFLVLMPALVGFGFPLILVGLFSLARYSGRGRGEGSAGQREVSKIDSDLETADEISSPDSHQSRALAEPSPPPSPGVPGEGVSRSVEKASEGNRTHLILVAAIPVLIFVVHSYLWFAGKMASYGEIRYLLIVSPFWAMLAAIGWERSPIKPSPVKLAVAGLLLVFACKMTFLRQSDEAHTAERVAEWYTSHYDLTQRYPRVIASHPAVYVYLNLNPTDRTRYAGWSPAALEHPAGDEIVIWDPKCGPFNADNRLVADVAGLHALGWTTFEVFPSGWVVLVRDDGR